MQYLVTVYEQSEDSIDYLNGTVTATGTVADLTTFEIDPLIPLIPLIRLIPHVCLGE